MSDLYRLHGERIDDDWHFRQQKKGCLGCFILLTLSLALSLAFWGGVIYTTWKLW